MKLKCLVFLLSAFTMSKEVQQPMITKLTWGTTQVEYQGKITSYKDCKVFPSGSCIWDWRITGTEHIPGIQIADLEDFIDDVDEVILSNGMHGVLKVKQDTLDYLKNKGKTVHCAKTEEAVALYNKLADLGKKVGILIHSTC